MSRSEWLERLWQRLAAISPLTITAAEVSDWPAGIKPALEQAGWLQPLPPANAIICPGCEEDCWMALELNPQAVNPARQAFILCELREDSGKVYVDSTLLQQWQISVESVARWLTRQMGIRQKPERKDNRLRLGIISGNKRSAELFLALDSLLLQQGGHELPLAEVVVLVLEGGELVCDGERLRQFADLPVAKDRYQPNTARREVRKLETAERNTQIKKRFGELKRQYPDKPDTWIAGKIARSGEFGELAADTVRKIIR